MSDDNHDPLDPHADPQAVPQTPEPQPPESDVAGDAHEEEDLLDNLSAEGRRPGATSAAVPEPVSKPPLGAAKADPQLSTAKGEKSASPAPSLTSTLAAKTAKLRKQQPRQHTALLVIGAIALVALVLVAVVATRDNGRSRTAKIDIHPATETGSDVDTKFKLFMAKQQEDMPSLQKDMKDITARVAAMEGRIDAASKAMEVSRANDSKRIDERLSQIMRTLERSDPGHVTQVQAGDFDAFLQVLQGQKSKNGLSLEEARLRIETWLRANGFDQSGIAVMRDRGLDRLGYLYVGDVAEPPLSTEELASIPEPLREAVKGLVEFNQQNGSLEGKVLYREEESLKWLRFKLGEHVLKTLKPDVLKRAAFLGRVRKENATKEQEEVLPDLAAKRDARGISPTDAFRTEAFIFETKAARWPSLTPGQHLAITAALSGVRANAAEQSSKPHPLAAGERDLLTIAARDAVAFAKNQGVTGQEALLSRARNAIKAKATDLKTSVAPADLEQLALTAVAEVLRASPGDVPAAAPAAAPAEGAEQSAPRHDHQVAKGSDAPAGLHLGPLVLTRDRAAAATAAMALVITDRLHLDPRSAEGGACLAAIFAAAPAIGNEAWDAVNDKDQDLRTFSTAVVQEFQELITKARPLTTLPVAVAGVAGHEAAYQQAVDLGRVLGAHRSADRAVVDVALKQRLGELAARGLRVAVPAEGGNPWARFQAVFSAAPEAAATLRGERLAELSMVIQKQLTERKIAHQQVALPGFDREFTEKLVRELDSDLVTSIPVIVAQHDDGRIAPDLLGKLVITGENRYATAAAAEAVVSARGMQAVADRFASLFDNDSLIEPLYSAMRSWIPDHVHATLEASKPDITDGTISAVAMDTANSLADPLTQFIIRTIIGNNIDPRVKARAGTLNQAGYQRAMEMVRAKLDGMTIEPLTIKRVDELTIELHQQAIAMLEGGDNGRRGGTPSSNTRGGQPVPGRPGYFDVKDEGLPGLPIGSHKEVVNSGQVFGIPRGSAMHVYLEIGADVPLKQADGGANDRVQFRSRGGFFDPTGKWYAFPSCILQGRVKPNPGGDRNMVELDHLVTVVNGVNVDHEISGLVTDEEDGVNGMRAAFLKHYDKIIPEAAELGVIEGISQGLASTRQTNTVVVPGATSQTTNTGSSLQYGLGAGLQKGTDILVQYQQSYIDKLSPTLKTWNGQKLVAQFFSTVEFPEVTEKDWRAAAAGDSGWNGF